MISVSQCPYNLTTLRRTETRGVSEFQNSNNEWTDRTYLHMINYRLPATHLSGWEEWLTYKAWRECPSVCLCLPYLWSPAHPPATYVGVIATIALTLNLNPSLHPDPCEGSWMALAQALDGRTNTRTHEHTALALYVIDWATNNSPFLTGSAQRGRHWYLTQTIKAVLSSALSLLRCCDQVFGKDMWPPLFWNGYLNEFASLIVLYGAHLAEKTLASRCYLQLYPAMLLRKVGR